MVFWVFGCDAQTKQLRDPLYLEVDNEAAARDLAAQAGMEVEFVNRAFQPSPNPGEAGPKATLTASDSSTPTPERNGAGSGSQRKSQGRTTDSLCDPEPVEPLDPRGPDSHEPQQQKPAAPRDPPRDSAPPAPASTGEAFEEMLLAALGEQQDARKAEAESQNWVPPGPDALPSAQKSAEPRKGWVRWPLGIIRVPFVLAGLSWGWFRRHPRVACMLLLLMLAGLCWAGWGWYLDYREGEYTRLLTEAQDLLGSGKTPQAEAALDRCSSGQRGWEWHFLKLRCQEKPAELIIRPTWEDRSLGCLSVQGPLLAWVAGKSDGSTAVEVRDLLDDQLLLGFHLPQARIDRVRLSPDGRYLALMQGHRSDSGNLVCYDVHTGIETCRGDKGQRGVDFGPSPLLLRGQVQTLRVPDLRGDKDLEVLLVRNLKTETEQSLEIAGAATAAAFSPDGSLLAVGDRKGGLKLWHCPDRGEPNTRAKVHQQRFHVPAGGLGLEGQASPAGIVITRIAPNGPAAKAGLLQPGQLIVGIGSSEPSHSTFGMKEREFASQVLGEPGTRVALRVEVAPGTPSDVTLIRETEPTQMRELRFSPDGQMLAALTDGQLFLWRMDQPKPLSRWVSYEAPLTFTPDGRRLLLGLGSSLAVVDVATGKEVGRLSGLLDRIAAAEFTPDGRFTLAGKKGDKTIALLFDAAVPTGKEDVRSEPESSSPSLDKDIETLSELIRLDPNNAAAYRQRGLLYLEKRSYAQGKKDLERAQELNKKKESP